MNKKRYNDLVQNHMPKPGKMYNAMKAFIVGGSVGVIGQLLIDVFTKWLDIPEKEANTYRIIVLVFFASLFTAMGFFDNFVSWARAGLIVPITGFAHAMTSASLEYKREGLITGIGSNIFKISGSVILYGVVAAYVFGIIRYLLFGG